ncbi:peptidase S8/S53 domain-containing protein [Kalaharituber pfeilii]|nr:peptidase S8/S53 domain-containing protein [Kalaharituber pfeilii]
MPSLRHLFLASLVFAPFTTGSSPLPNPDDPLLADQDLSLLAQSIPESYIVVLKKSASRAIFTRQSPGGRPRDSYSFGSFFGYTAVGLSEKDACSLSHSPEVDFVEPNRLVRSATPIRHPPHEGHLLNTTTGSWNLHRISHRPQAPSEPGPYSYLYNSAYLEANCTTDAYLIDTGIYLSHSEFEGRASHGINTIGGSNEDGTGHGTHVAGILVGKTFGVARKGHVISVKALDSQGFGTYASVIAGLEWAVLEARRKGRLGQSVVNLSLVGHRSAAVNAAVEAAHDAGLPVVVAAGNFGSLAVDFSPASAHNAFTIAASSILDSRPSWSNYGIVIDHFAPGADIRSSFIDGPNSTAVLSGTSMAAPHVAGMVNYLQCVEGLEIPRMIRERLEQLATIKEVEDGGNTSPKRIVYNGAQQEHHKQ